jgi:carbon-monoxide dehydrogenase medium subunit
MYPRAFDYHRATSLAEAARLLRQLGEEAKVLAGGQSLIPLMKLRYASPRHLVDLNFIPGLNYIRRDNGALRFGPLARHAEIERSGELAGFDILRDCAAGIADVQVRSRGTIGGSVAEADPSGDWGPVLLALDSEVRIAGPAGERTVPLPQFFVDAYTTVLEHDELIREITVKAPLKNSGGAYIAFKRCAPVYASASAAAQLALQDGVVKDARIVLGCVGLTAVRATEAEKALRGQGISGSTLKRAAEAAMASCDPQSDMRGSAEYKRVLVGALVKKAVAAAARRASGEQVKVSHEYLGS